MKFTEKYKSNISWSWTLIKSLFEICEAGHSKVNLTALLRNSIIHAMINDKYSVQYSLSIIDELFLFFNSNYPRNIFCFSKDKDSGLVLDGIFIPINGYCFFAWINIEWMEEKMCIWHLGSNETEFIELYAENKSLVYNSNINGVLIKTVLKKDLEENTWYFIELYVTKNKSIDDLVILQ